MTKPETIAIVIFALYAGPGVTADILHLPTDATIIVSADEAVEEIEQDIIHFRGNFRIKTPGWSIIADQATVYGKLDNMQRIVADGSPVQFFFRETAADDSPVTEGEGLHLEFEKEAGLLRLSGNAKLTSGERIMQSSEILYNLELEKLEAGGAEGVRITIKPDSNGKFKKTIKKVPDLFN